MSDRAMLHPRLETEDGQARVSESLRRDARLRQLAIRGEGQTETACERCFLSVLSELEKQLRRARYEAELYARSERQHTLDAESRNGPQKGLIPASTNRFRLLQEEDKEDIEAAARTAERKHCRALREAIVAVQAEMSAVRQEREALVGRNRELDSREECLWRETNNFEWELEAFQDACAQLVTATDKRRREDAKFQCLVSALEQVDPDRASFDAVDAYVRTASRELANAFDESFGSTLAGSGTLDDSRRL